MDIPLPVVYSAIAGLFAVLWGINLFEIRELRKDNKLLATNIAALTATIATLTAELGHKVSGEQCASHRMEIKNGQ